MEKTEKQIRFNLFLISRLHVMYFLEAHLPVVALIPVSFAINSEGGIT